MAYISKYLHESIPEAIQLRSASMVAQVTFMVIATLSDLINNEHPALLPLH